jgi:hypothetical protein
MMKSSLSSTLQGFAMRSYSRFSSFLCASLCAAASLAIAACHSVGNALAGVYFVARRWLAETALARFTPVSTPATDHDRPAVELVQARTYLQRLVKRDGLRYAEAWRMCPLT